MSTPTMAYLALETASQDDFGYYDTASQDDFFKVDMPHPIQRVFNPLNNLLDVAFQDPIEDVHFLCQRFLGFVVLEIAILYVAVDVEPYHLDIPITLVLELRS